MSETSPPRPASTYAEAERALLARWPETRLEPSLDRIAAFCELLGEPQRSYPVIQLTGTNGKTSTSRMIDTLVTATGLRTGRFTSPHVESMTERISLDGEPLTEEQFLEAYLDVAALADLADQDATHPLSFFETVVGDGLRRVRERPGRRRRRRGGHGRVLGRHQRRRRDGRGDHPDRRRPQRLPRLDAGRHRAREVRDHQGRHDGGVRGPGRRRRRRDRRARHRGRCHRPLGGPRLRGRPPGRRRRRPDDAAARSPRRVRRGLPPAARRPPGAERRPRARRGRGVHRRGRRSTPTWSRTRSPRSPRPAGSR